LLNTSFINHAEVREPKHKKYTETSFFLCGKEIQSKVRALHWFFLLCSGTAYDHCFWFSFGHGNKSQRHHLIAKKWKTWEKLQNKQFEMVRLHMSSFLPAIERNSV
jgi:hypothetical protein